MLGCTDGANRKLGMVIVQITCSLLLLPLFYGPSSALKTDMPPRSTVSLHTSSGVSLWRIFSTTQNISKMAHALCFLVFLCFASCCAEKAVHALKDLQVQDDTLWWLKSQEEWVRYFIV